MHTPPCSIISILAGHKFGIGPSRLKSLSNEELLEKELVGKDNDNHVSLS